MGQENTASTGTIASNKLKKSSTNARLLPVRDNDMNWALSTGLVVLASCLVGCANERELDELSCAARKRIESVLSDPQSEKIYVTDAARGVDIQPGWCASGKVQLVLHAEASSRHDVTYQVYCDGKGRFNFRMVRGEGFESFSVEPYKKRDVPPKSPSCPARG